jgi:hypothetical protein
MAKKPLEKYNPHAFRNRLPEASIVMPHKNSSQIVFGDRTYRDPKRYATINKSIMISPRRFETTNPGIIATLT